MRFHRDLLTSSAVGGDIRFALRQMARTPLFSGVVIAVIALGIGINAALMTTLNVYAWNPAPGIESDGRLARLLPVALREEDKRLAEVRLSYAELTELRAQHDAFADVAAYQATSLAADFGAGAEPVLAFYTTGNYFRTLGVAMSAGIAFSDASEVVSAPIAIISHSVWLNSFGGATAIVGRTIRVMNVPFTVVGVAPPRFVGIDVKHLGRAAIWMPLGARKLIASDTARLTAVARLAPGVSPRDVERRTALFSANVARQAPETRTRFVIRAERLAGMASGDSDTHELLAGFFIVAALIIVITCTNVSALLLGRAVARRREIGIRLSLGATRLRLIRQMLTESLVYSVVGAVLALALYAIAMKIAYATIPGIIEGIEPQPATFGYAAAFALATTIVFGLTPALHATRRDISAAIRNSGVQAVHRSRLQGAFVVVQLACSMPVLIVTSLVLADARTATQGADAPASVLTMDAGLLRGRPSIVIGGDRDSAAMTRLATFTAIRDHIERRVAVQSVALLVEGGSGSFAASANGDPGMDMKVLHVSSEYLSTLGIPLQHGRAIGEEEDRPGSRAVVVNRRAADLLWPGQDAVGKRLVRGARRDGEQPGILEVIGVAGAPPYDDDVPTPTVYAPLFTAPSAWSARIAVRARRDARALATPIRLAIREVEPFAAIGSVSTLAEQYANNRRDAMQANLAAFTVGAAALLLASLGLYAIIAFAVAQRTREIGVRLAMGATPGAVVRHFFRGGLRVSAIGIAIGLPVTVAAIRIVQANALGFTLRNVAAVFLVVPVLIGVAGIASWLPARRAAHVDPLTALRAE